MRQAYELGGQQFSTKAKILERARAILRSHKPGDIICGQEDSFFRDLLQMHPRKDEKIGCGVREFEVTLDSVYGNIRIEIVRDDLSITPFSFNKCLNDSTKRGQFVQACRLAIEVQVLDFKSRQFGEEEFTCCAVSGVQIGWRDCHIDHSPPNTFAKIVEDYIKEYVVDVEHVGFLEKMFTDVREQQRFMDFHEQRASLRLVDKDLHMKISRAQLRGSKRTNNEEIQNG